MVRQTQDTISSMYSDIIEQVSDHVLQFNGPKFVCVSGSLSTTPSRCVMALISKRDTEIEFINCFISKTAQDLGKSSNLTIFIKHWQLIYRYFVLDFVCTSTCCFTHFSGLPSPINTTLCRVSFFITPLSWGHPKYPPAPPRGIHSYSTYLEPM